MVFLINVFSKSGWIILLSWIIFGKRKLLVSFKTPTELTDDELDDVLSQIDKSKLNNFAKLHFESITNEILEK